MTFTSIFPPHLIVLLATAGVLAACAGTPAPKPAPTPVPTACADTNFPIYFEKDSDDLTGPARDVLDSNVARVKGCPIGKIEVLGLADSDGARARNLALSRRRAAAVAKRLMNAGLPAPTFDIEALGEAGARAPDGKPDPMRRRTEVVIHMAAKSGV